MNNNFFQKSRDIQGGALAALKNFFTPDKIKAAGIQNAPSTFSPSGIPSYGYQNFNPYQIKTGDTFENIAKNSGQTVQALQQANGGMAVPPPKGSYINMPTPLAQQTSMTGAPFIAPQSLYPGQGTISPQPRNTWDNNRGDTYDPKMLSEIQGQIDNGQVPQMVPVGMLASLGATPQSMIENGYTFNPVTRQYYLTAGGGAQTTGAGTGSNIGTGSADFMNTGFMQKYAANNTPFEKQLRWDPKAKKYVQIGKLIKQGKLDLKTGRFYPNGRNAHHGGPVGGRHNPHGQPIQQEQVPGAGGTPQTVLNLHLGGG